MKKITLQVDGREMSFSEQELIAIVKEHLSTKTTQQTTTAKVAQKPTEDAWFEVKPQAINQKLFEKKKEDSIQEATRKLILEAFVKMKEKPEKYGRDFKTLMPKKTWDSKTVAQLKEMASNLGDHNADWIEQALEWAQRISNGESWETICNDKDTANWHRLIVWKHGYNCIVGGSVFFDHDYPASDVGIAFCDNNRNLKSSVPLVVLYE